MAVKFENLAPEFNDNNGATDLKSIWIPVFIQLFSIKSTQAFLTGPLCDSWIIASGANFKAQL